MNGPVNRKTTYKSCWKCSWYSNSTIIGGYINPFHTCNHPNSVYSKNIPGTILLDEDRTPEWCPLLKEEYEKT